MKRYSDLLLFGTVMCVLGFYACSKDKTDDSAANNDAFKKGMLTNYADNIILPGYADLQVKLGLLETSANNFLNTPSTATQDALKASFKTAWLSYENVSAPYFGPAAALGLNSTLNSFPCTVSKIEAGISSGSYNLTLPVSADSIQGFPALDYLFFSADAVQKFSDAGAANRKKYVQDVIARMKLLLTNNLNQWNASYRDYFIASTKTNVGSSIGYLVNQLAFEMDALKGPRIGYGFGKQSNGVVFANKCEGYYSGISAALAVANLSSLKNYYTGGNGDGISEYLLLLNKSQLNSDVLAQFEVALNALKAIPDPMSAAFTNNAVVVEAAYKEVQKLLTLLKTDVASATAVQITYMDNDGD